jgi:hypothetical protein
VPLRELSVVVCAAVVLVGAPSAAKSSSGGPPPAEPSAPVDNTPFSRPLHPGESAVFRVSTSPALTLADTVVSNTDPSLAPSDTWSDSEPSIAVDSSNPDRIVIEGFSSCWNLCTNPPNAALWTSTNGGALWTKSFSVPPPTGVSTGVGGCPCDQTPDYDRFSHMFSTFLTFGSVGAVYTGSTTDPTSSAAWSWHVTGNVADKTNAAATNADQPWVLVNRDPLLAGQDNTYVAYDDFATSAPTTHVAVAPNSTPPAFTIDHSPGVSSACCVNPGLRLAVDHGTGTVYALWQQADFNSVTTPHITIRYQLNRSTDGGNTWGLNGSPTGIQVASGPSDQIFDSFAPGTPRYKFGTVNALLGGIDSAAVDPTTGDLYYVFGLRDPATSNNRLWSIRFTAGPSGTLVGGPPHAVTGQVQAALPSVAVNAGGTIGVLYDTFDGFDVMGFPIFTSHVARSDDHGTTFADTPLVTFTSPQKDNGNVRQRVLGDYHQMKAVGDTFFGTFTGNGAAFGRSFANTDAIFFRFQPGPSITSLKPTALGQGAKKAKVTITGQGFVSGAAVSVSGSGVTVNSTSFTSAQKLIAKLTVASGAALGQRDVTVTNPGGASDTCNGCLTIQLGPSPTGVAPPSGARGTTLSVVVSGSGFAPGATAKFGAGITVNSTSFVDSSHLSVNLTIAPGATTGTRNVTVVNKDKGQGTCFHCFTVT